MEWPAHPPLEGGGGASHLVHKFIKFKLFLKCFFCNYFI